MLPFTKRPGRGGDEAEAGDVVTKASVAPRAKTVPPGAKSQPQTKTVPPQSTRSSPPGSHGSQASQGATPHPDRPRLFQPSISDEEMTTLMPSKATPSSKRGSRGGNIIPAAGRPASTPAPRLAARDLELAAQEIKSRDLEIDNALDDDEGDDGRTQIRQPLAGRLLVPSMEAHPADAPEPTRAMMGAPHQQPVNLARIPTRLMAADEKSVDVPLFNNTPVPHTLQTSSPHQPPPRSVAPPPMSQPPPMMQHQAFQPHQSHQPHQPQHQQPMVANLSGGYPQQMGLAPAMSQPAHFAVPQLAPSEARIDPPATVLTQRGSNSGGSRTMSWAAALMAVGVFVGLAAAVVAGGTSDSLADTGAAFVDPAHPARRGAPTQVINQQSAAGMAPNVVSVVNGATVSTPQQMQQMQPVQLGSPPAAPMATQQTVFPQVAIPGQPVVTTTATQQPAQVVATTQAVTGNTGVNTGIAPATQPAAVQAPVVTQDPAPVQVAQNTQPPAAQPVRKAASQPVIHRTAPAAQAANDDSPPAAAPAPTAKKAPTAKAGKGGGDDDELKKAADALSKAQLENSL